MAKHAEVTAALGTLVYFCDPASPWQRASNENANGLLRQYFRKGTDLSAVEQADVSFAADEINGRPRAVLAWDSATIRFAGLESLAALQATAGLLLPPKARFRCPQPGTILMSYPPLRLPGSYVNGSRFQPWIIRIDPQMWTAVGWAAPI